jgi:hypothetical protein
MEQDFQKTGVEYINYLIGTEFDPNECFFLPSLNTRFLIFQRYLHSQEVCTFH